MVDFEMTNSGDLKFSAAERFPGLSISWYESEFPVLCLNWEQQETPMDEPADDSLTLAFSTSNRKPGYARSVAPLRHSKELAQRITILLRTELGSTPLSPEFGTLLDLSRHKDIRSMQVLKAVQNEVLSVIDGLVEKPSVVLKVEEKDGPFYCENVNLYIYQENELIYKSSIIGG